MALSGFSMTAQANPNAATSAPSATCTGQLAAGTYGDVTAEAGCAIDSSVTVTGNVTVVAGGSLSLSATTVSGNVTANGSGEVQIEESTVSGNVQVVNSAGPAMIGDIVGQNLVWQGDTSTVYGFANQIGQDVTISGNTGGGLFWLNAITQNCSLSGDSPAIAGFNNTAGATNGCNLSA